MEFSPGDPYYLWLISAGGLFVSFLFLRSLRNVRLGVSSKMWKPITAKVESVRIDYETDSDNDIWYRPKIKYGFRLKNGRYVSASKVSFRPLSTSCYIKANNHTRGLRVGGEITIYQNPKNDYQTVVLPGINIGNVIEPIFYILFLGLLYNGYQKHLAIVGL